MLMRLGDAPGDHSDEQYTGTSSTMDYFRDRARQYQEVLNALDQGYAAAAAAIDADIDDDLSVDMYDAIQEFEGKRLLLTTTARAINLGAEAVNAVGGRFPVLSIPSGLGFLPALPLAAIAAIAAAATLITWGVTWLRGVNERLKRAQLIAEQRGIDPAKAAALVDSLAASDNAVERAENSPVSAIASTIKWVAIGAGAWFVYRAWSESRGRR